MYFIYNYIFSIVAIYGFSDNQSDYLYNTTKMFSTAAG